MLIKIVEFKNNVGSFSLYIYLIFILIQIKYGNSMDAKFYFGLNQKKGMREQY